MARLRLSGRVEVWKNRELLYAAPNLIVDAGEVLFAQAILGELINRPSHMACGASSLPPKDTQVALQGAEFQRVALTPTRVGNVISYLATFGGVGLVGAVTIAEFGIFNANAAGTMLARFTCSPFSITAADEVPVTWRITVGEEG